MRMRGGGKCREGVGEEEMGKKHIRIYWASAGLGTPKNQRGGVHNTKAFYNQKCLSRYKKTRL